MPNYRTGEVFDSNVEGVSSAGRDDVGGDVLRALSSCLETWQHSDSWDRFLEALAPVRSAAMQAGHLALHDVCVIMHERIVELSETQAAPDDEQCAVLAAWPSFATAWVESTGETRHAELLVEFLQHPMWPRPLGEDEAIGLRDMLVVETGAFGSESLLEATIEALNAPDGNALEDDESTDDGISGFDGLSGYSELGTTSAESGKIVPDVRARIGADGWEIIDSGPAADGFSYDALVEDDAGEERVEDTSRELPDAAHEVIQLLVGEASQIASVLADIMPVATSESADEGERREALELFAEQVERFFGAVEMLGLNGLCLAGRRLHMNLRALCATGDVLSPEVAELLGHLCTAISEYLERPQDRAAAGTLTSLLAHPAWPLPADPDWIDDVETRLASPVVLIEEVDGEDRAAGALAEDVSLELPDDVEVEVLEGLLQALPAQTADFSRAIDSLVSGSAPNDLVVAQRIAHTVKGAANTVGIAGLANLTHHVEDILVALGKHGVPPAHDLSEVLVRAAGCLTSMGEALVDQAPAPADALDTLQSVLDWANSIDEQGVAAFAADAGPTPPGAEASARVQTDEHTDAESRGATTVTASPTVHVASPAEDDLLRLVGKTIELAGQIQERLDATARETRNLRKPYQLVQQLGREMQELIELQDSSACRQRVVSSGIFDALELDQYDELHTCSRRLIEAAIDIREIGQAIEDHLNALKDVLSDQGR